EVETTVQLRGAVKISLFSIRSRHTSSYGDWSSDVCSPDLEIEVGRAGKQRSRDLGQIGHGRISFRAPVELEHGRAAVVGHRSALKIFGPDLAVIEALGSAELEQPPLEHGITPVQARRHENALAAVLVGGDR